MRSGEQCESSLTELLTGSVELYNMCCIIQHSSQTTRKFDYVYLDYTTDTTDEGMPIYRYIQNDAPIYGLEGIAELLPIQWISIKAAFNYTRGKQSSSANLPFIHITGFDQRSG